MRVSESLFRPWLDAFLAQRDVEPLLNDDDLATAVLAMSAGERIEMVDAAGAGGGGCLGD